MTYPSQPSPIQIWLLAARPKTLPAAAAPVVVGTAVAISEQVFSLGPALAALLGALLIQIGTNFANDVFDYKKGADRTGRLGPMRVTQAGLLTPGQVLAGMWLAFGLAALIGLYLVIIGGWPIVVIGLLAIASGIAYTGGPFPLGYKGLGDLFVFIFFGLVAVCGTYYVQAGTVSPAAFWAAVPMGLLATAILVVNNLRDINTDRAAGKKTLAVRFGPRGAQVEYLLLLGGSYAVPLFMALTGPSRAWGCPAYGGLLTCPAYGGLLTCPAYGGLLTWLSLPLVWPLVRSVLYEKGRPLNRALAGTARLELVYGLLFSVGVIFPVLVR